MKSIIKMTIMAVGLFWIYTAAELKFEPHVLFKESGGGWGQTGFGDFDKDGKLDFVAGRAFGGPVYWWQQGDDLDTWTRHTIHKGLAGNCVGGEAYDVDHDGFVDWVTSRVWFKNNGKWASEAPQMIPYSGGKMPGKSTGCHDVIVVDIDGDGFKDIMNHAVTWWKNPGEGAANAGTWESHQVADRPKYHGAVAPKGWGDIDGDGDNDVVGIGEWFKNADGAGKSWERIEYAKWSKKNENRPWVADYDSDGDQDIAVAEGDHKDGKAAWFENVDGKGNEWKTTPLPGIEGDLHSSGGIDFDMDGDNDIFTAQNGGGDGNDWVIFENTDGKGTFEKRVIYTGWGAHESIYADFDADGDIDIVSKCWCSGPTFVLLENKADPVNVTPPSVPQQPEERFSFKARVSQNGGLPELEVVSNASGRFSIELFNTQGARLANRSGEGQVHGTIPMGDLKTGIYLVRLNMPRESMTQRVILSR